MNSVQLTSWGNGTLKTYKDSDGATWTYTYDAMNRLTEAKNDKTGSNAVDANFYYDGLNRQIARSITGEGTIFSVWDGWQLYAEMAPYGALSNHWVYGGNDLIVSTADSHFYYPDGLGNTTYMAGALGYLLETYTYDAFGTVSALDLNDNSTDPSGSLLFKGQKWYPALGLYDLRNRAYLPSLGRFLQPDPIGFAGDPSNLYRYCGNNSVNGSDPFGTEPGFGTAFGFVAGGVGGAYQAYVQTHSVGLAAASFVIGGVTGAFAGTLFEGLAPGVGALAGGYVAAFGEGVFSSWAGQIIGNTASDLSNGSGPGLNDLANINPGLLIGAGLGNAGAVGLRGLLSEKLLKYAAFRGAWAVGEGIISGTGEMGGGQLWNWIFTDTDPDGTVWREDLSATYDSHNVATIGGLTATGVDPNGNGSAASGGVSARGGSEGGGGQVSVPAAWASYIQGTFNGYGGGSELQRLAAQRHYSKQ